MHTTRSRRRRSGLHDETKVRGNSREHPLGGTTPEWRQPCHGRAPDVLPVRRGKAGRVDKADPQCPQNTGMSAIQPDGHLAFDG